MAGRGRDEEPSLRRPRDRAGQPGGDLWSLPQEAVAFDADGVDDDDALDRFAAVVSVLGAESVLGPGPAAAQAADAGPPADPFDLPRRRAVPEPPARRTLPVVALPVVLLVVYVLAVAVSLGVRSVGAGAGTSSDVGSVVVDGPLACPMFLRLPGGAAADGTCFFVG